MRPGADFPPTAARWIGASSRAASSGRRLCRNRPDSRRRTRSVPETTSPHLNSSVCRRLEAGQQLLQHLDVLRQRILPQPLRPNPEAEQHGTVQLALARLDLTVLAVLAES